MSYPPPQPGYPLYPSGPVSSNQYPPPSPGGSGIGFESLMISQPAPNVYGQPPRPPAPYPTGQMPAPGYGAPPAPMNPMTAYGAPPPGMPAMPMPGMNFGQAAHVAHAAAAFQAPRRPMPAPGLNVQPGYGAPPYAGHHAPPTGPPPPTNVPSYSTNVPRATALPPSQAPTPHPPSRVPSSRSPPTATRPVQATPPNRGTVKPRPNFNAQVDAEAIRKAVGGFGTNVKEIIGILSSTTNAQRQKIALEYKSQFGRDLNTDLKYALGGSLENLLIAMMSTPAEYDAAELRRAMKGLGTNESVLIEILCSRTNSEMVAVKQSYHKKFGRDLEKDVQSETSGNFRKFLTSLLQGNRDETTTVDYGKASADANALYQAGEKRWGTDESRFNVIFASRSYAQLRATFNEYAKICKYDIERSVEREMSGDLKNSMTTLVQCVRNTPGYFATKLYKSMKGLGTDDATLIRVVVTRCEVDMAIIKQEFQRLYQKTLADFIKGDTSGNYRKTLLGLIGERE